MNAVNQKKTKSQMCPSQNLRAGRLRRLVTELRKLSELETRSLDSDPIKLPELLEDVFILAEDHPEAGERVLTFSTPRAPWHISLSKF